MSALNITDLNSKQNKFYYLEIKNYLEANSNNFSPSAIKYISKELNKIIDLPSYNLSDIIKCVDLKIFNICQARDKRFAESKALNCLLNDLKATKYDSNLSINVISKYANNKDISNITITKLCKMADHIINNTNFLMDEKYFLLESELEYMIHINNSVANKSMHSRLTQYAKLRKFLVSLFRE